MTGLTGNNAITGAGYRTNQPTYEIERSVVLGDSAKFTRTPSSAGNRKTWTWSGWVKRGKLETNNLLFSSADSSVRQWFGFYNNNLWFDHTNGSYVQSDALYRDVGSWYHIVVAWDTTQSTDTNRIKIYVNGEQISLTVNAWPALNQDGEINNTSVFTLGNLSTYSGYYFDGYLAEMHFIDGTALDASSFGKTNAGTNQWIPKKYSGSYGTNGFYLDFATRATDPIDASGNGNNWSSSNVVATDWRIDTPTNNFATMNTLDPINNRATTSTFAEGNLKVTETGGNYKYTMIGNFGMSSGKWYFEFCGVNSDNTWMIGIADITKGTSRGYTGSSGHGLYLYRDGDTYSPTSSASYGVSWTYGDVIGVAVDLDNNALYFAKNNTWMNSGDPTSGSSKTGAAFTTELADRTWAACMGRGSFANTIIGTFNFGQDSSFAGAKTSQGNGPDGTDLYYDPPSGYIPMCTAQIDDPSIADTTKHFNTVTYSGNSSTQAITGVGHQPDFTWFKARNNAYDHSLVDSVRGVNKAMASNTTSAESGFGTNYTIDSFDSDGFTLHSATYNNASGTNYVAWNWKAGGTASNNEDGSITSSVSANTDAGFSIVAWTGTGSNVTVGHGLSQAPELIINKSRGDAYNWAMQSFLWNSASDTNLLYLNTTAGTADDTNVFQAAPTATVFSPQGGSWAGIGTNTIEYIAYCVHSVDGYSKVGSYTGNGAQDGSFVYTGFRPAFIFIKRITSSGSNSYIVDNKRIGYNHFVYLTDAGSNKYLWPDSTAAEGNGNTTKGIGMDILSNGFKFRTSGGDYNASGNNYLFYAIAESPFKYSNAR